MKQNTWFITGAGSGLGYHLTKQLLAKGEKVAATTRKNFDELNKLKEQYGDQLWISPLDITHFPSITQVVHQAFLYFGTIDILVSNAGYILLGAVEEVSEEQILLQLQTNLIGSILLIKAFIPYLRKQGHGKILQMSSEAGQVVYPALASYHAAKWGIEGFCESLLKEIKPFNISVTLIEPGRIKTGFDGHAAMPKEIFPAYQNTTVGNYRRLLAMGKFPFSCDLNKTISSIIERAQSDQLPLRLTLGSYSYKVIHSALVDRMQQLEQQEAFAQSIDIETHH